MTVVKCYNSATGAVETVSDPLPDADASDRVNAFATADTNTDHVYYADRERDAVIHIFLRLFRIARAVRGLAQHLARNGA